MLKKINWQSVFITSIWLLSLLGLSLLMGFVARKKQNQNCTSLKIKILGVENFLEREEINAILKQNNGKLVGQKLANLNLHQIEQKIRENPYVAFAKVYADMDGKIYVKLKQREPILRVINIQNKDFYIDNKGVKIPISTNFAPNVLVATGDIYENFETKIDTLKTKLAIDLYKIASYIQADSVWNAQIVQIYVTKKNEIQLIPRIGIQRIILGNADSLETKMHNLFVFYKNAMPKVGWNTYKTINLKYPNQIVCEKNDVDTAKKIINLLQDSANVLQTASPKPKQVPTTATKKIKTE